VFHPPLIFSRFTPNHSLRQPRRSCVSSPIVFSADLAIPAFLPLIVFLTNLVISASPSQSLPSLTSLSLCFLLLLSHLLYPADFAHLFSLPILSPNFFLVHFHVSLYLLVFNSRLSLRVLLIKRFCYLQSSFRIDMRRQCGFDFIFSTPILPTRVSSPTPFLSAPIVRSG
jgi:hypothetical protein